MKKSVSKRTIYTGIFSAFFTIYLILMAGFSIFLISQEKKVESLELRSFGGQVNQIIEDVLKDNIDDNYQITNIAKVKKEFVRNSHSLKLFREEVVGTEVAIFTGDSNLIYNTNDYWLCSYTEYSEGGRNYTGYGSLNPKDWFSEKEITEIENYLYADPKAKKKGDISGYVVDLEGFWVDNETIIPDKIRIITMRADDFDEHGNVISSSGNHINNIIFTSGYVDAKDLPYIKYGNVQSNEENYPKSEMQTELTNMVLDKEKLKKAIEQGKVFSNERAGLLKYRYYLLMPYQNTIKTADDQKNYSEFWTVITCEVNLWRKFRNTLLFVWISCFIAFFVATTMLSREAYKIFNKREEIEKQRQETTNALAHDLKTPLSIISGYSQNLIENIHTEKRAYYADSIQRNVNRMDKIIGEMLELSKLESNMSPVKFEEVSLGEVGREVINRYKEVCDEKDIMTYLEGDAIVMVDQYLITRVVDNFFVNAFDNTPKGGTIGIRICDNKFEVYNSGSYIPEDKMNEIWLPYKKADMSRSNTKGTGLGLAISSTILDSYKFSYGAQNVEEGVVFWFKFIK